MELFSNFDIDKESKKKNEIIEEEMKKGIEEIGKILNNHKKK